MRYSKWHRSENSIYSLKNSEEGHLELVLLKSYIGALFSLLFVLKKYMFGLDRLQEHLVGTMDVDPFIKIASSI